MTSDYPATVKFLVNSTLRSKEVKSDQVQGLLSKNKVQFRKKTTFIDCKTGHSPVFLKEFCASSDAGGKTLKNKLSTPYSNRTGT